jgi:hypothetical protein
VSRFYILGGEDGRNPERCDLMTWARWFEQSDRTVAFTQRGDVSVSTVFLGINHNFRERGPAVLFETMTFRGTTTTDVGGRKREIPAASEGDGEMWRYSTWDDALAGHAAICRRVFGKNYVEAKCPNTK